MVDYNAEFVDLEVYEAYNQPFGGNFIGVAVIETHFHKRSWRTESAAYVQWDPTDPMAPYPGGGTLDPLLGTILWRWTT